MGWAFPLVTALATNAVETHEQGDTEGTVGAAHGLGMIVGPPVAMLVYDIESGVTYALVAVLLFLAALWPARALASGAAAVPEH